MDSSNSYSKIREMGYDPKNITDADRREICQKLDEDLDKFIEESKGKAKIGDKKEESVDEILDKITEHPAFMTEIDYSKPLSDDVQGLMAIKYESEDPIANATSYKEEGNDLFKKKKYKLAIENYTTGINIKPPDKELNAVMYSNRAACHFHIQNFRSSLNDSIIARKFKPDHMKAIIRGAQCCLEINKWLDAIKWCDTGFLIDMNNQQLLQIRTKAEMRRKEQEKEKRREKMHEKKQIEEEKLLLKQIDERGITLAVPEHSSSEGLSPLLLTSLELHNPSNAKVHVDSNGVMFWPVLFLYPEHTQSDYIESFCESHAFNDHIEHMFSAKSPPATWDTEHKYTPDFIEIYFENKEHETFHKVKNDWTLLKALQHKQFVVHAGTPAFVLVARGSEFYESFLKKHSLYKR